MRDKLSWTHWRTLLKVQDEVARDYYLTECIAEKNNTVVEYTLPKDEKQIFAAKYLTYLPTEEELRELLAN